MTALALLACSAQAEEPVPAPPAALKARETGELREAIFAGGCFWGVEAVFSHVKGVTSAVSGYHGGDDDDADYRSVSAGRTDHAEAVRVTYDPSVVRYDQLLRIFFAVVADPTQLDRQGPDRGRQYRNALVPLDPAQRRVAKAYLAQLGKANLWPRAIVTRIEPARTFHPAEAYHQDFAKKNPDHPYIRRWDAPKVRNLQVMFPTHYRVRFQAD